MRITAIIARNRERQHAVRERAYRTTWGRPRWADGSPIPTTRDADPVPATTPEPQPEPTRLTPVDANPYRFAAPNTVEAVQGEVFEPDAVFVERIDRQLRVGGPRNLPTPDEADRYARIKARVQTQRFVDWMQTRTSAEVAS